MGPKAKELENFLARCRLLSAKRRMERLFDRCCHGGIVSYRLPRRYRIDCTIGRPIQ